MKRLVVFIALDIFRILGLGIFLSILFLLNNMERFGGVSYWTMLFYGRVFVINLILAFLIRFLWFRIFTKYTDDITLDYKKFVEETKVKKWL